MKTVYLLRTITSDQGTEGTLIELDNGFMCRTLELPWRENKPNISCVPSKEYMVKIRQSPKYGKIFWLTNVPNRSYILIHNGNYAGNRNKGFKTHVAGCILLGSKHGFLNGQRAILNSRITLRKFMNHMNEKEFKLHIIGDQNVEKM